MSHVGTALDQWFGNVLLLSGLTAACHVHRDALHSFSLPLFSHLCYEEGHSFPCCFTVVFRGCAGRYLSELTGTGVITGARWCSCGPSTPSKHPLLPEAAESQPQAILVSSLENYVWGILGKEGHQETFFSFLLCLYVSTNPVFSFPRAELK